MAAWRLGAGRARKEDPVQVGAGVVWHARPGDQVTEGQPLFTLLTDDEHRFERALASLDGGYDIAPTIVRTRRRSSYAPRGARWSIDRIGQGRRDQRSGSSRTTVSATQAGLGSSSISTVYFRIICLPAGRSTTSPRVTCARTRLPTRTGLGKRTLLTP